ncbi:alpha/beta hydrolase family protein [Silvibacterium dinghuense]|nr:dienelactone hydrolase family protein [Silvibacterium dinghuense]
MPRTSFAACLLFSILTPALWSQQAQAPAQNPSTERWDILSLTGSGLHAQPPILGQKDTLPDFTRELIQVQWRDNDPMDLYVIRPAGIAKPPVVLVLYSYPTDTAKFLNNALCENFIRHGFAVAGFVSALTGSRYHDRPMKQWFVSQLPESIGASVHDVQMVINYLETRSDLDADRVGIFGQGSGGTIAILAAATDSRIQAVDVMDPWGDWPNWLAKSPQVPESERPAYLRPEFLASVAPLDPVHWLTQWRKHPTHTVIRIQENLFNLAMPEDVRRQMETAAAGSAEIVEYHSRQEYLEKVSTNSRMLDWMQSKLDTKNLSADNKAGS